jgi:hypothetical protein
MDIADVYRIFHPTSVQYTFFSEAHGTFSKIDYTLGHKASLGNMRKQIISCILSDHSALKLDLNNKNNSKHASNWKLNNTLPNDQRVIDELKEEIKKFLQVHENDDMTYQNPWDTAKASIRGKFIAMSAYIKRSQINYLMLHLTLLEKQEQEKPETSRGREIIKNNCLK